MSAAEENTRGMRMAAQRAATNNNTVSLNNVGNATSTSNSASGNAKINTGSGSIGGMSMMMSGGSGSSGGSGNGKGASGGGGGGGDNGGGGGGNAGGPKPRKNGKGGGMMRAARIMRLNMSLMNAKTPEQKKKIRMRLNEVRMMNMGNRKSKAMDGRRNVNVRPTALMRTKMKTTMRFVSEPRRGMAMRMRTSVMRTSVMRTSVMRPAGRSMRQIARMRGRRA